MDSRRIAVFGLGYVGCVTAASFARLGHFVTGVDRDELKVSTIQAGRAPFFEPGLDALVGEGVTQGRLSATTDAASALTGADAVFLCVGTPSERNGNIDLQQLHKVSAEIAQAVPASRKMAVVVRSTVFPGSCEEMVAPLFANHPGVRILANPEFLREGCAVDDFLDPSLQVVGGEDRESLEMVAALYAPLGVSPCLVSLRTAEMIKYACNCFHAVKISFANEIAAVSEALSVDGPEVMRTLCRDTRLNISTAYLRPGFAFGGSCLPKDLRALTYRASRLDVDIPLLATTLASNEAQLRRAVDRILDLPARRIGVIGLAFKENTDDLRESPSVALLESLIGKGRDLRVFDPHIQLDSIYGANRNFILNAIPHISRLLMPDIESLLAWCDHVVVTQAASPAVVAKIRASGLPVADVAGTGFPSAAEVAAGVGIGDRV